MIIGISGKIDSGKDTVGRIIQYLVDFYTLQKDFPDAATDLPDNPNKEDFDEWLFNMGDSEENNVWEIKKFAGKLKQIASLLTGISVEDLEEENVKNSYLGEEWKDPDYVEAECRNCGYGYDVCKLDINPTVRNFLQILGTEAIRNTIHENAWVNALMVDYKHGKEQWLIDTEKYLKKHNMFGKDIIEISANKDKDIYYQVAYTYLTIKLEYPNWIITDVRFPNELKAVKNKNGICIRINRLNSTPQTTFVNKHNRTHPSETALDNAEFNYVIDNNGTIDELINKVKEILIKEKII